MNTRTAFRSALLAMSALGALAVPAVARAQGSAASAEAAHDFNVPAQPLARALSAIAEQGDIQVVYPDKEPLSINTPAVKGRMSTSQALATALAGSGYSYRFLREGVVTLVSTVGNGVDGEVAGVVQVEGIQASYYFGGAGQEAGVNGINGSRDITATEGTQSFTSGALTIGSKVPQALKDVPQSISVLTNERIEQQNVTDFTTAMKQLPGVTLVQSGNSLGTDFYSRGFKITSIQVDGGMPLTTSFPGPQTFFLQIDMAQYDHVELLRGAAGALNGYGDPSGVVNLTRKKPLDHGQFIAEAQLGSWNNYRLMMDASSPIALDGGLRGRLVMTYQKNDFFYDVAQDEKVLVYGIAELDITPTTLLSAGISYSKQNSVPWQSGLPRFANGDDLQLPRNTSFVFPWNRWNFDTTQLFGTLDQKIGDNWLAKLNITRNRQSSSQKLGYSVNAVTPGTNAGPILTGTYYDFSSEQVSSELTLSGKFNLLGQDQFVVFGVNRADVDGGRDSLSYGALIDASFKPYQPYPGGPVYCQDYGFGGCPAGSLPSLGPPINVFAFDPYDPIYREPSDPLATSAMRENGNSQFGAYATFDLTPIKRLHVNFSLRYSEFKSRVSRDFLCTNTDQCAGKQIGDPYFNYSNNYDGKDFTWPPSINISYDVTENTRVYFGYTDIYVSQATLLDKQLNPIAPVTGSNFEAGVKVTLNGGRLNLTASAYRIDQHGFGITDYTAFKVLPDGSIDYDTVVDADGNEYPGGQIGDNTFCCFVSNSDISRISKGIDLEITGEIARGLQLAASYTYNDNKYSGGDLSEYFGSIRSGQTLNSRSPRHLYKLWLSYVLEGVGSFKGIGFSGGVTGQSDTYFAGTSCSELDPPDDQGVSLCKTSIPYNYTIPPYAIFSGRIDLDVDAHWSLAVNIDNIFDKRYYQTSESAEGGNWYGAPRSFTATLRAKW